MMEPLRRYVARYARSRILACVLLGRRRTSDTCNPSGRGSRHYMCCLRRLMPLVPRTSEPSIKDSPTLSSRSIQNDKTSSSIVY
ncbi:hypothetical protein LshimejAT787_1000880 [Lyophyllum shimeji]|uniref:Uncharacterized protein n=1 Tax=Lyophyllum shimeji TaxID=47721 RepID=A0A9P3PT00_LYOSH|nr:hypothetical protein LshimejAT787_1000880 [Lyophyllum shimeji]